MIEKVKTPLGFEKVITRISQGSTIISAIIIMVMMLLTVADVFLRYVFRSPLIWNYDLQSVLIVCVIFLGIAYVQIKRRHIQIDIITTHLSKTNRIWFEFINFIIFLCFTVLVTWQMSMETQQAFILNDYLEGIVRIPVWPAKGSIALGCGLLSIILIFHIIQDFQILVRSRQTEGLKKGWYIKLIAILAVLVLIVVGTIFLKDIAPGPTTIGWIALIVILLLLLLGTPIAAVTGLTSIWGVFLLSGDRAALGMAASKPFQFALSSIMTCVPLFIAMGIFAGMAGFASNAYETGRRWLQGIPGGLVHATIFGSAMFAAASGVSSASCATFAKMVLPEMRKLGVKDWLAIGSVACSSTLAIMIPPSLMLVTYALLTQQSVGKLLIAGFVPGIIQAIMYMIMVYIMCRLDPSLIPKGSHYNWKERFVSLKYAWGILFIVFVVMGGIYTGVFTPIEAAAIGTFVAFVAVLVTQKFQFKNINAGLLDTVSLTSSIILIIIGGMMFGTFLAQSRLPTMLTEAIVAANLSPLGVMIAVMVFYLIIGSFMDSLSVLIITLPIVYPLVTSLGWDPIWFGIIITLNIEVSLVSPPYGLNLFILQATVPDLKMSVLYKGVMPFILNDIVRMALFIAFPQIVLWLPNLMWG
jgi:C4-dicarboxylate transporter, DctM subunit